jgi:hypothetical protein
MKTEYTPDNTTSSIVILMSSAVIVIVIAMLIGLSSKPDVSQILLVPGDAPVPVTTGFDFLDTDDADAAQLDESEAMIDLTEATVTTDDSGDAGTTGDSNDQNGSADAPAAERTPEGQVILVPTTEPTPTPGVAAAVEPTPEAEAAATTALDGQVQAAPSLPTQAGSVQGTFFTGSDELAGAEVLENSIVVSFAEDGSGAFQGILNIIYGDGTRVELNMSGPVTFAAANPQVEASVSGSFRLEAPISADDLQSDDAELRISSLAAGSGSLCTGETKCFGFTFLPQ